MTGLRCWRTCDRQDRRLSFQNGQKVATESTHGHEGSHDGTEVRNVGGQLREVEVPSQERAVTGLCCWRTCDRQALVEVKKVRF